MSKTNSWETDFLRLIFENAHPSFVIGGSSGVDGSATAGNFYIALFTADPTDTGSVANECTWTSYARVARARTTGSSGWTVTGNSVTNGGAITFPTCTGGSETATHFGICKAGTASVADLIFHGALSGGGLAISSGVTPQIAAGNLSVTED